MILYLYCSRMNFDFVIAFFKLTAERKLIFFTLTDCALISVFFSTTFDSADSEKVPIPSIFTL